MICKGVKGFIKLHRLNGISVNLGLIGLNLLVGCFSCRFSTAQTISGVKWLCLLKCGRSAFI